MTETLVDAVLVVKKGIPGPKQIPLKQTTTVLGRSSDADITVDDPRVSDKHCQIRHQNGSFYLRDGVFNAADVFRPSTNGTYLNSLRLNDSEEKLLSDGDLIDLLKAQVVVKFQCKDGTLEFIAEEGTLKFDATDSQSDIRVESGPREVYVQEALIRKLSNKQFNVIELLYQRRGNAVSREDIAAVGWDYPPDSDLKDVDAAMIEACIHRIRKKIEPDPKTPTYVVTVQGYGYKMP